MNLNQVTVAANSMAESIAFYRSLGLILIVESEHYARFECPEGDATFSIHLEKGSGVSKTVIYFEVKNLEETVFRLESMGIEFTRQPREEPWLWRESRLHDPAGNEICLYTAGKNRKYPPWRIAEIDDRSM